jgi:hypothetical protein
MMLIDAARHGTLLSHRFFFAAGDLKGCRLKDATHVQPRTPEAYA